MSRGIIYPAYGYTPVNAPGIGRVAAVLKAPPVVAIDSEGEPSDDMAARYWAAMTAVAGAKPRAAINTGAIAKAGATVIDQADTARFHRRVPDDNPFVSLIESRLHLHLAEVAD
jgi:broad specificity phosphatase PhoE